MKKTILASLTGVVLAAGSANALPTSAQLEAVLTAYADNFVVPTYKSQATNAVAFMKAAKSLKSSPSDKNVKKTVEAYLACREFWEQSEAFLFGPASFASLDPKLDSWPLDQAQLDGLMKAAAMGAITVDADYVRDYVGAALRGFHAAEYLLFRDGQVRSAQSMTPTELAYLAAVAQVIAEDSTLLEGMWAGADSLSSSKSSLLDAAELDGDGKYAWELKNAGRVGSRYDSQMDAIEEIFVGATDITSELAGPKFGEPFEAQDPQLFESWYSQRSFEDNRGNIQSVEKAYCGVDAKGASISSLVAAVDPAADAAVKSAIQDVYACIDAFEAPAAKSLGEAAKFKKLIAACETLAENIEKAQKVLFK